MPTPRQEREIEELMRQIKQAKDNGAGEKEIKSRTNDLYAYLVNEGLVRP